MSERLRRPSLSGFWRDAWHQVRRPWIPTLVALVVVMAGTLAIFATTGQAVAGQVRTMERLNSPQGRLVTVTDSSGQAGLDARSVSTIASMPAVEWVVGVGAAVDVANPALRGSGTAPARRVHGHLPSVVDTLTTRPPRPGDAIATEERLRDLGLSDGVGAVAGGGVDAVVTGSFTAAPPLQTLENEVLVLAPDPDADVPEPLLRLYISVTDVTHLDGLTSALRSSVTATAPGQLVVETTPELAQLSGDVTAELTRQARLTLLGLLGTVSILVGALQYGRVSAASRDIGRRRALGASRSLIVAQVLLNATITGLGGATLGALAGLALNAALTGALPGALFTLAVITLVALASAAAAVPPAVRAARIDPVRILRVP